MCTHTRAFKAIYRIEGLCGVLKKEICCNKHHIECLPLQGFFNIQ